MIKYDIFAHSELLSKRGIFSENDLQNCIWALKNPNFSRREPRGLNPRTPAAGDNLAGPMDGPRPQGGTIPFAPPAKFEQKVYLQINYLFLNNLTNNYNFHNFIIKIWLYLKLATICATIYGICIKTEQKNIFLIFFFVTS